MSNCNVSTGHLIDQKNLDVIEFLAFRLGIEEYGVDILRVQEIRSFELPTRLANSPEFLLGVVNLRGTIVPIVDMRIKFEMASVLYNSSTVVIVLNLRERVIGIVVDAVSDVVALTSEQLRPVPAFSGAIDAASVLALGAVGDRMLILLDIESTLNTKALQHALANEHNSVGEAR